MNNITKPDSDSRTILINDIPGGHTCCRPMFIGLGRREVIPVNPAATTPAYVDAIRSIQANIQKVGRISKDGIKIKDFQAKAFRSLDLTWSDFPEQNILQIGVPNRFQDQEEFRSSTATQEALLKALDYRYRLIQYNKKELGITVDELKPALKALVEFDLDQATYLLYGFGLKAEAYLRMAGVEEKVRYWASIAEISHDFGLTTACVPYLLPVHTGKVVKLPNDCYGYGLHVFIGKDQRLPVVPASGRKQEYIVPDNPHIDMRVPVPSGNRQQKRQQRKTSP